MAARANASLAWGLLHGRLANLPPAIAHHFSCLLVRHALCDALDRCGFRDAAAWLPAWFSGLRPPPGTTAHTAVPAWLLVDAILAELGRATWDPLAQAAEQIRSAARFARDDMRHHDGMTPFVLLASAETLAARATEQASAPFSANDWPLRYLDQLHALASSSADFAPQVRERSMIEAQGQRVGVEQPASPAPLWALEYVPHKGFAQTAPGLSPLPLPGAIRAEALQAHLRPRERAILVANGVETAVLRLSRLLDAAHQATRHWEQHAQPLRSNSRAPMLYRLLSGFGPLCPVQIETALGVSKAGVREVVSVLLEAKLASSTTVSGRKVIAAKDDVDKAAFTRSMSPEAVTDPQSHEHSAIAEFDAALAGIDEVLERLNRPRDNKRNSAPSPSFEDDAAAKPANADRAEP